MVSLWIIYQLQCTKAAKPGLLLQLLLYHRRRSGCVCQLPNPFHSFSVTTILHPTNAKNASQTHNDDEHPHLLPPSLLHVPTICILPHTGNHFKFHCTKRWTNNDYYWTILNPSSISPWGKFYFLSFGVDMVNTVIRNRREMVFQCLKSKVSFYRCISDASLS